MSNSQPQFNLLKEGQSTPVFVGDFEVVNRCFETLKESFFFVAGNAKPVVDEFPFSVEPR